MDTEREAQAHRDVIALLDAAPRSATVREMMRAQQLADDGIFTDATGSVELEVADETQARELVDLLPVNVTMTGILSRNQLPVAEFNGKPVDVAIVVARKLWTS